MVICCDSCGNKKEESDFYKKKNGGKINYECKECVKERITLWNKENAEHRKEYLKKWRENHKDITKGYYLKRRKNNLIQIRERNNNWAKNNRGKKQINGRKTNQKIRNTAKGKLSCNISRGVHRSLVSGSKNCRSWEKLVGYTVDQLKNHLENQFTGKINWDNYGSYWHIDHKLPVSFFDFKTPDDDSFRECWSLDNLQPLEAIENLKKGSKVIYIK
jgi:hypothetical protein